MNKRTFIKLGGLVSAIALLCRKAQSAVLAIGNPLGNVRTADATGITSNTTLASDSVLTVPIAANAKVDLYAWVPFSLAGIVSGYKFGVSVPASPTNIAITADVTNLVGGVIIPSVLATAGGLIASGALATIGNHRVIFQGTIENGANAGSITIQAAQNTSDTGALTILRGAKIFLTPLS